jgi:hypothetical protein
MAVNWKRLQPTSLLHALRLCKDYARARRQLSVERIADRMGVTHDALYKWLGSGRMPVNLVPAYEQTCGIDYVSRWLAMTAGKLVIDIPTGKCATPKDIHTLQDVLNTAVGSLIRFHGGQAEAPETLAALQTGLEALALHRGQVAKHAQPEFEFGGDE